MRDYVNSAALQEYTTKLVAKLKTLFPGTPTAVATVAEMTDHNKTYVYVGTETGYTAGDWYYWDGSAWTSGGPFQATSIITDTTLAVAGEAADAKATGDAIAAAKAAVLNAMAPAYSTSATYAVGDYVNYNGAIYRCTTAISTAEAWTAGHWAAVTLGADLEGQVSDLKTQLNAVSTSDSDGFGLLGIPALPQIEHIYPRKALANADIVDNAKNVLFYNLDCVVGTAIELKDYTNYRFFLKYLSNGIWLDYKSTWFTERFVFAESVKISVYVRNTAGTDLTNSEVNDILNGFKVSNDKANIVNRFVSDERIFNNTSEIVGKALFGQELFAYRKIIAGEDILTDNTKTILVYPISVSQNSIIGLLDYSIYKFCYKEKIENEWGSASDWYSEDILFESVKTICLYVRRIDSEDVTGTDLANVKNLVFFDNTNSLVQKVSRLEYENIYNIDFGTDFENRLIPSSLLTLPDEFSTFPITVNISKSGDVYGHDISPNDFIKNNANGATYYVSPNGDDTNNGKSPSASLKSIDTAIGKSDVNTIILLPGKYINGINFGADITKDVNIIGTGKTVLYSEDADSPLTIKNACYIENIIFDGGVSACETLLETELCVFNKCAFINSASSNGLTAKGGYYVLFDCVANNNMLDGFNYHGNTTYKPQTVEICCKGKLNGNNSAQTINNGSTNHENGSRIIRIGCEYAESRGGVIADADGAISLNIACKAFSTLAISAENRNANYVLIGATSKMWLYDCRSFGSPYDIIADTGTIYTDKTYTRESAVNSGTISRMS